ncbi:MAG: hypothetical protein BWK79_10460 [Beggiatoa sp. IS2]|nr:MAG: hypothetical protein BWK79_10460 [Beggiatoa sp. IS2]
MENTFNLIATNTHLFLLTACLSPFLLAGTLLNPRWQQYALTLAPWSALPALLFALSMNTGMSLTIKWAVLGLQLGIDPTGQVFLGFTAFLWLVTGFFIHSYMVHDPHILRFFVFYLLSMGGNIGVILAQDVGSFYLFFTMMNFATYGFIVHGRNDYAYHAGWLYIGLVLLGEIALFTAMLFAVHASSGEMALTTLSTAIASAPQRNLIISLLVIAFGSKLGLLGLHVSLPVVCHAIPVAGAIVFGGAMLNVGLLGWLRFLPLGEVALPGWGNLFIILGLLAAFYGAFSGLFQEHIRAVLAYSCISQMGIMTLILGIGLAEPQTWLLLQTIVWLYVAHYTLAIGALFFGIGIINATANHWTRFLALLSLLLPALALAGAPWTSGAVMRSLFNTHTYLAPTFWSYHLGWLLSLIAFMTTLLMGRLVWLAWYQEKPPIIPRLSIGLWLPWVMLLGAIVWVSIHYYAEYEGLLVVTVEWQMNNPVVLGMVTVLIACYLIGVEGFTIPLRIPEGDVLWPLWTRSKIVSQQFCVTSAEMLSVQRLAFSALKQHWKHQLLQIANELLRLETQLTTWNTVGLVFLLLIVCLFVLLANA